MNGCVSELWFSCLLVLSIGSASDNDNGDVSQDEGVVLSPATAFNATSRATRVPTVVNMGKAPPRWSDNDNGVSDDQDELAPIEAEQAMGLRPRTKGGVNMKLALGRDDLHKRPGGDDDGNGDSDDKFGCVTAAGARPCSFLLLVLSFTECGGVGVSRVHSSAQGREPSSPATQLGRSATPAGFCGVPSRWSCPKHWS